MLNYIPILRGIILLLTTSLITPVLAQNVSIQQYVPNAMLVGKGRFSYVFWDIYDARLYAPKGRWQANQPFALKLTYLRHLKGNKIADKSIEQMEKQGVTQAKKLKQWQTQMRQIFPNVEKGESLVGIRTKAGATIFLNNDHVIGAIDDPAFTRYFFNIWLAPNTSAPDLRKALLGLK